MNYHIIMWLSIKLYYFYCDGTNNYIDLMSYNIVILYFGVGTTDFDVRTRDYCAA